MQMPEPSHQTIKSLSGREAQKSEFNSPPQWFWGILDFEHQSSKTRSLEPSLWNPLLKQKFGSLLWTQAKPSQLGFQLP